MAKDTTSAKSRSFNRGGAWRSIQQDLACGIQRLFLKKASIMINGKICAQEDPVREWLYRRMIDQAQKRASRKAESKSN